MKDLKPIIFIVIVLILTAISAYPQRQFGGTIVEVIDGKTFVMQTVNGKITGVLQYIEIPEPEQPLHQTVKEHLEKIILNQTGEFKPLGVGKNQTFGQLIIGGVDISQQMLRDGAAWYAIAEKNGQMASQSALYQDNEAQAKAEKRGIWSIPNLKPAWEFRAEKVEQQKEEERQRYEKIKESYAKTTPSTTVRQQTQYNPQQNFSNFQNWSDIRSLDSSAGVGGLISKYDSARRFGYTLTTQAEIKVIGEKNPPYLDFRLIYAYADTVQKGRDSGYLVAILVDADEYKFVKSNNLTVFADKQKFEFGKAFRIYGESAVSKREILFYRISRTAIAKLANAKNLEVKVGGVSGKINDKLQNLAKNLLNMAE